MSRYADRLAPTPPARWPFAWPSRRAVAVAVAGLMPLASERDRARRLRGGRTAGRMFVGWPTDRMSTSLTR
jgi:hypothetical protein